MNWYMVRYQPLAGVNHSIKLVPVQGPDLEYAVRKADKEMRETRKLDPLQFSCTACLGHPL